MKTVGKLALIFTVIAVVALAVAAAVFFSVGRAGIGEDVSGKANLGQVKSIASEGIDSISIETSSADIRVIVVEAGEISSELTGSVTRGGSKGPELIQEKEGDDLRIGVRWPAQLNVGLFFTNLKLTVKVPESFTGSFSFRSSSGDVEIGELKVRSCTGRTSSGNIRLGRIEAREVTLTSSSGEIEAEKVSSDRVFARSSSGDVTLFGLSGDAELSSSSGNILIGYSELGDSEVRGQTSSGTVSVTLPPDSAFRINLRSSSGKITCDFPVTMLMEGRIRNNRLEGTVGTAGGMLDLHSSSGDISVSKG